MWDIGRHVDEIAGARFFHVFEVVTPAEAGASADNVEHGFEFAVMVRTGAGVGGYHYGPGPQLISSGARVGDGGSARHASRLRSVGIEFARTHNTDSVFFPIRHEI